MNKKTQITEVLFTNGTYDSRKLKGREGDFKWLNEFHGNSNSERVWNVLFARPTCHCGKTTRYINFREGYRKTCSCSCAQMLLTSSKSSRHSTLWDNQNWKADTSARMKEAHFKNRCDKKLAELLEKDIVPLDELSPGFDNVYRWKHKCGEVFTKSFKRTFSIYCPKCHVSKGQGELYELIRKNYHGEILVNERQVIAPKEIDIYLPELRVGFEFNGRYWHRGDGFREIKKVFEAAEAGVKLIHIWEVDWIKNRKSQHNLVLSALS